MGRSSTAERSASCDVTSKVAQQRPSWLELGKGVGNAAETLRLVVGHIGSCDWKCRFRKQRLDVLKDLLQRQEGHTLTMTLEATEQINALAIEDSAYGYNRHGARLALENKHYSANSIQKIPHA